MATLIIKYIEVVSEILNRDFFRFLCRASLIESPVQWIVKIWKQVEKKCWIKIWKTVSESVEDGKDEVEAVANVDGDKDMVEAVTHLSPVN